MFKYILVIFSIITQVIYAQDQYWSSINTGNSSLPNETVKCMAFDSGGALWIGTYMGGLAVKDGDQWTIYNTSNSELPHNYINTIAIDQNDVKWIGTDGGGLARFDGDSWQVFKTSTSGLPSNVVMTVFCDTDGIIWVGTYFGGLASFDGQNWKVYNDENSALISNKVVAIVKDNNNLLWVGTQGGGLGSFDGKNWTIYTERNSKLSSDYIYSIAVDKDNNKWIGTGGGGVAVFNNVYWINFNSKNSKVADDNIRPILVNEHGHKWVGTYIGGLNVFNGEQWKVFNYKNSPLPDDEINCLYYDRNYLYIGTERSGLIVYEDISAPKIIKPVEEPIAEVYPEKSQEEIPEFVNQEQPSMEDEIVPVISLESIQDVIPVKQEEIVPEIHQEPLMVSYEEPIEEMPEEADMEIYEEPVVVISQVETVEIAQISEKPFVEEPALEITLEAEPEPEPEISEVIVQEVVEEPVILVSQVEIGKTDDLPEKQITEEPVLEITYEAEPEGIVQPEMELPVEPVIGLSEEIIHESPEDVLQEPEISMTSDDDHELVSETEMEVPSDFNVESDFETADENILDIAPEEVQEAVEMAMFSTATRNKIVLVFDAADVYFDKSRLNLYRRSFSLLLKNRERVNENYDVTLLVYSSNYDLNPRKIVFTPKQLKSMRVRNVVYLEGETQFTEALKKAYLRITDDYNSMGNNHVIAATYKFLPDDQSAKALIWQYTDKNNIVFSLLAYETSTWKMEFRMKDIVPKGQGHYYSLSHSSFKDNWSVNAQIGLSLFKGDFDVDKKFTFPGEVGIGLKKQVLSTGMINGGIKGQFNFGQLKGSKNNYTFENKYKEGSLNFHVILNTWFNRNFRFEKIRPYAFTGIGFINYRVLLRNPDGYVENGYGYKVTEGDPETNGKNPPKSKPETDLMIPLGAGLNYKISKAINIELEASSRFINSDKLDGRVRYENDKYWFFSVGITYMFSNKEFLADILKR